MIYPGDEGSPALCLASRIQPEGRATQHQMHCRRMALWRLASSLQPATVRQVFYQGHRPRHRRQDRARLRQGPGSSVSEAPGNGPSPSYRGVCRYRGYRPSLIPMRGSKH
jgi:hypothetical protein